MKNPIKTFGDVRKAGRVKLVLTAGVLVAATVAVTGATSTDFARLNFVGATLVESPRFDIGIVRADGAVEQADKDGGFDWAVAGASDLVPGKSVSTTIPVFNNTYNLKADTSFQVVLRNGDGRVAPGVPIILPFLRFTATDETNKVIFTDVTWDQAKGALGVMEPRWGAVLNNGEQFTPAASGSAKKLNLTIKYIDGPGVENYNGGQAALSVRFDAVSAAP